MGYHFLVGKLILLCALNHTCDANKQPIGKEHFSLLPQLLHVVLSTVLTGKSYHQEPGLCQKLESEIHRHPAQHSGDTRSGTGAVTFQVLALTQRCWSDLKLRSGLKQCFLYLK